MGDRELRALRWTIVGIVVVSIALSAVHITLEFNSTVTALLITMAAASFISGDDIAKKIAQRRDKNKTVEQPDDEESRT